MSTPQRVRRKTPTLTLKQENSNKRTKLKAAERLETSQKIDSALSVLLRPNDNDNTSVIANQENENQEENCDSTVARQT